MHRRSRKCCHAANATISPGAMLGRASEPLSHLKPWCTWSLALMRIGNMPTCHQVKRERDPGQTEQNIAYDCNYS
jgi:hypothetical protein